MISIKRVAVHERSFTNRQKCGQIPTTRDIEVLVQNGRPDTAIRQLLKRCGDVSDSKSVDQVLYNVAYALRKQFS